MKRVIAVVGILLGILLAGLAASPAASAHAEMVSSDPANGAHLDRSPSQVTLRFSESVDAHVGFVRITDSTGKRIATGSPEHPGGRSQDVAVSIQSPLNDGGYLVSWRVLSADSHPISSAFSFAVGNGALLSTVDSDGTEVVDSTVGAAFDAVRWISFAGMALSVGGGAFLFFCWPAGRNDQRARRLLWSGWGCAVGATLLGLGLQGPYAAGSGIAQFFSADLLDSTLATTYGRMLSLRLVFLATAAFFLRWWLSMDKSHDRREWTIDVAGLAALGSLATFGASGHASTGIQPPLAILSDTIHLAAMSAWLGGLVMLISGLLFQKTVGHAELSAVLPRFSRLSVIAITTLVVSGGYQLWRQVGTLPALWRTDYGILLLIKIGAVTLLLVVAYLSRQVVQRRYVKPIAHAVEVSTMDKSLATLPAPNTDSRQLLGRLRRSVLLEVVIAAVILGLSAVLVAQQPARESYVHPYAATLHTATGDKVDIDLTPARNGQNDLSLDLSTKDNRPIRPISVTATASLPSHELGPISIPLTENGVGHYRSTAVLLPQSGTWQVTVSIRTSEFDESSVLAKVPVR